MTPLSPSIASSHSAHIVEGWIVSLLLHSAAVLFGMVLVTAVKLAPEPKPFQWDVSVVQGQMAESLFQPISPVAEPAHRQRLVAAATVPAAQRQVVQPGEPTPAPTPEPKSVITEIPPTVARSQPTTVPAPSITEAIPNNTVFETVAAAPAEPVSQVSAVEPQFKQHTPHEPAVDQMESKPVAEPLPPAATASVSSDRTPALSVQATEGSSRQVAALKPAAASTALPSKSDRGWLSDFLFRRVEELKHYPSLARVDRLEGKVIVGATLHENGQLSDLEVLKSSGHDVLDRAAIQVLREASPLQLPRPLEKSAVPIRVPISYGLIDGLNSAN